MGIYCAGMRLFAFVISSFLFLGTAHAFDYLEHSYFSDRACLEAQLQLGEALQTSPNPNPQWVSAYLALALACPERWDRNYCSDGYKQLEAQLAPLDEDPMTSGDHPLTLGDFASLPDHLSQFGSTLGFGRAQRTGLLTKLIELMIPNSGEPGGVISDVAEDACETDNLVDWQRVDRDIVVSMEKGLKPIANNYLLPGRWALPTKGPSDPAGAYSFDNPHFLDLVFQNHHHFEEAAFESWTGFHAASQSILQRGCREVVQFSSLDLGNLAEGLADFNQIDWEQLSQSKRQELGCQVLALRIRERLLRWQKRAEPLLVEPVLSHLKQLKETPNHPLAASTSDALLSLVFEALGLHFIQDNLAGGHLRVQRAAYGLAMARHMHDEDGRLGVVAFSQSTQQQRTLVAFGDGYLLGKPQKSLPLNCFEFADNEIPRELLSDCLMRRQRGFVVAQSTASLLHWASGNEPLQQIDCQDKSIHSFICNNLPINPSRLRRPNGVTTGTLPQPPPPFAFQSISTSLSLDGAGEATQMGLRLVFLSELGQMAHWMTSYHLGLMKTSRPNDAKLREEEMVLEMSYMFHWRWAARFLVNAGAFGFGGPRGLGDNVSFVMGTGPNVGLTFLPEGWTKIPLELSLSYRVPISLYDSRYGWSKKGIRVQAHWIEIAFGLAFM